MSKSSGNNFLLQICGQDRKDNCEEFLFIFFLCLVLATHQLAAMSPLDVYKRILFSLLYIILVPKLTVKRCIIISLAEEFLTISCTITYELNVLKYIFLDLTFISNISISWKGNKSIVLTHRLLYKYS